MVMRGLQVWLGDLGPHRIGRTPGPQFSHFFQRRRFVGPAIQNCQVLDMAQFLLGGGLMFTFVLKALDK